jgi:hypothetical protein
MQRSINARRRQIARTSSVVRVPDRGSHAHRSPSMRPRRATTVVPAARLETSSTSAQDIYAPALRVRVRGERPMTLVEVAQVITPILAAGTLVSAFVAVRSLQAKIDQDGKDLRRKQAEVARLVYNDLREDEYSVAALLMLDYEGWRHRTCDFQEKIELSFADVRSALATESPRPRPDKELLVRRSIDSMFDKLEYVAALAEPTIALLLWKDFAELFGFYVGVMRSEPWRDALLRYAEEFKFHYVVRIIKDDKYYPISEIHKVYLNGGAKNRSADSPQCQSQSECTATRETIELRHPREPAS